MANEPDYHLRLSLKAYLKQNPKSGLIPYFQGKGEERGSRLLPDSVEKDECKEFIGFMQKRGLSDLEHLWNLID